MGRTKPDLTDPVQARLTRQTLVARELGQLSTAGQARVLDWLRDLVEDGGTAEAELRAMRSIAYRLGQGVSQEDRAAIVRRLREDYGQPDGASATTSRPSRDDTIDLPSQGRPVTRT